MNRRKFLKGLAGCALIPTVVVKVATSAPTPFIAPSSSEQRTLAELMGESNDILAEMVFVEERLPKRTVRTGLPDVVWRKLNYGVSPRKGKL